MTEEKQPRTAQEIQQEYFQVCAQIGDLQVKHSLHDSEVKKRLERVKELNVEVLESNAYYAKMNAELEALKNEAPKS